MSIYAKLLEAPEWKEKRKSIVGRDNNTCVSCGNSNLFDKAVLCKVSRCNVNSEWIVAFIVSSLEHTPYRVFIPVQGNKRPERGSLMLVLPSGRGDGIEIAHLIARKTYTDQDFEIAYLEDRLGKENARFIQAFETYKKNTYTEWKNVKGLQVHHKYYQVGAMPWEYPDGALTTLCWYCHEELHKNSKVPVLDRWGNKIGEYTNCSRCHGAGVFPEFSHVQSGICFRCNGAKYEELLTIN
ncbi:hypothetical protein [Pontibacter fetidus]|uniref:Uncharacterized protein n=1 Tax=Pontibacter fetidus TaxID=2700082 RepID=A0A6B2GXR1_9BACT|nr:hypothetical protein [Pontibacter fetidus]NDK54771.1 hypothetical protein [Pontibacter fetidus]